MPLERSRIVLQIRFIHSLDQVYKHDVSTKAGHHRVSALIIDPARGLINKDASSGALYSKYSDTGFSREAVIQAA